MRLYQSAWLLSAVISLLASTEARRIRVRPTSDEDENIHYYSAIEPEAAEQTEQNRQVVLVSADQYNGYYGQPTASPRHSVASSASQSRDNYYQPARTAALKAAAAQRQRDSAPKQPPVQTIRNYNKVNDDGSFTFGYEAADGSFKEETRGTDCVVRGKYGYIDPDGNKREFTYVSGNPCDPNAPKDDQEDEEKENEREEDENVPQNYPTRPVIPYRPSPAPKPAVPLFETNFGSDEEEQPEPEQVLRPTITSYRTSPTYSSDSQFEDREEPQQYQRQRLIPTTTPASIIYKQSITPLTVTPRPRPTPPPVPRIEAPATTYRPQLLQVAATPAPPVLYTKQISVTPRPHFLPSSTPSPLLLPQRPAFDLEAELRKYQQPTNYQQPSNFVVSNNIAKAPKTPVAPAPKPELNSAPVYSSELVYDPTSGQYKTQLYQTLPQQEGDFKLTQNIQPYVAQPRPQFLNLPQLQAQSPLYRPRPEPSSQAIYKQQQADLQFQNSAQLYAQQQRTRAEQAEPTTPQQYYFIQPQAQAQAQPQAQKQPRYTNSQLDSFLRGHNIQF